MLKQAQVVRGPRWLEQPLLNILNTCSNFPYCLCCGEEEMIGEESCIAILIDCPEKFTGYVGVGCVLVLGT